MYRINTRWTSTPRRTWKTAATALLLVVLAYLSIEHLLSSENVSPRPNNPWAEGLWPTAFIPGSTVPPRPLDFPWPYEARDHHPISHLIANADKVWTEHDRARSTTFSEVVRTYRERYGRHPPPGFSRWYEFARERNCYNYDDFSQIIEDLKPFWGVDPKIIRSAAAHAADDAENGLGILHVRDGTVAVTSSDGRVESFARLVQKFAKWLPDMDVAVNTLDHPRLVVPWNDIQLYQTREADSRKALDGAVDEFTLDMVRPEDDAWFQEVKASGVLESGWATVPRNVFVRLAMGACRESTYARNPALAKTARDSYLTEPGGFVHDFTLSSDLCAIGPEIQDLHGFFGTGTFRLTQKLLPVFSEFKMSVNNDILFPGNTYRDKRVEYSGRWDVPWESKVDEVVWKGTISGAESPEIWQRMHRTRLVDALNATLLQGKQVRMLSETAPLSRTFETKDKYDASEFISRVADVSFTEVEGCNNCTFITENVQLSKIRTLAEHFRSKFLIDIDDGDTFSGRWRAFLWSRSLGIKSTLFREWYDGRLLAWRHFVPMDFRYGDVYSILAYFMGLDDRREESVSISRHDEEAKKIAMQGSEWARRVLRPEDIEIYTFRLLLEYARIIDDDRHSIGYSADGTEVDDPYAYAMGEGGEGAKMQSWLGWF